MNQISFYYVIVMTDKLDKDSLGSAAVLDLFSGVVGANKKAGWHIYPLPFGSSTNL